MREYLNDMLEDVKDTTCEYCFENVWDNWYDKLVSELNENEIEELRAEFYNYIEEVEEF